jgi:uncharacterized protein (TIGR03118 family)
MYRLMLKLSELGFRRGKKSRPRRGGGPAAPRARPSVEALETRVVLSAGDWSMYNYDIAGTRDNTAEHTLSPRNVGGLQVLWNFPTAGLVTGTPAVVNNVVYAGDSTGTFYALNSNGQLKWQTPLGGRITASPLVTHGVIVIGNQGNGFIYGLDAGTGAIKWQVHPNTSALAQVWGSATPVGDDVAIGIASGEEFVSTAPTSRGSLVLLDPSNGKVIWQTYTVTDAELAKGVTGASVWGTPAYDPAAHVIYAGTGNNYGSADPTKPTITNGTSDAMIAFDAKTGKMLWVTQETKDDNWNRQVGLTEGPDADFGDSPHLYTLASGEKVVGAGQKNGFYHVLDAKTGKELNQIEVSSGSILGGLFATAAVNPKTRVVFANDRDPKDPNTSPGDTGHLFAIAGDASKIIWQFDTAKPDQSGVALANGVVYFQSLDGFLYALDQTTGALLAKVATGSSDSGPAISNGQLYVGQGDVFRQGFAGIGGITALGLKEAEQGAYVQTNLVSDIPGEAKVTDPNLKNPWGVSFSSTSPFWVSNQGTNTSTLYTVKNDPAAPDNHLVVTASSLVVKIPTNPTPPNGPTGQVFNSTSDFLIPTSAGGNGAKASFIFANLNGTISAWNGDGKAPPNNNLAHTVATGAAGSVYTGLAIGSNGSANYLYAANTSLGRIDVYNGSFARVTLGSGGFGTFSDPLLPSGLNLVPFNVQNIGGKIYVAYAPSGRPAQTGATEGQGAVAVFDTTGHLLRQLIVGSELASPWGMALAPAGFGKFGGDLLVGNFAFNDSEINAFNPTTGAFVGTLTDPTGHDLQNQALWALTFGNGGNGGDRNTLYFTAGINMETDGLFGSIQAVSSLDDHAPILPNLAKGVEQTFSTRSVFSTAPTVPEGGDQNPYGVAFVPSDIKPGGKLNPGDILVSNFNNQGDADHPGGLQGTGTSIIRITPTGERSVFFQGTGLGLTTALTVLKSGFVIVGNVPTTDGKFGTIKPGSLLVLDSNGTVVETLANSDLLDGPWDLTVNDQGNRAQVFVSNVLNGTVSRLDLVIPRNGKPIVADLTRIASGYKHEKNDAALVVGPTGLAYDAERDLLYVASTDDNAIYAIANAGRARTDHGKGRLVYKDDVHLHGPLALVLAPNGDLITANGDAVNPDDNHPSELVEFTPSGHFVAEFSVDPNPGGAFGIALATVDGELRFAAVNDNTNALDVWTFVTAKRKHDDEDDLFPFL